MYLHGIDLLRCDKYVGWIRCSFVRATIEYVVVCIYLCAAVYRQGWFRTTVKVIVSRDCARRPVRYYFHYIHTELAPPYPVIFHYNIGCVLNHYAWFAVAIAMNQIIISYNYVCFWRIYPTNLRLTFLNTVAPRTICLGVLVISIFTGYIHYGIPINKYIAPGKIYSVSTATLNPIIGKCDVVSRDWHSSRMYKRGVNIMDITVLYGDVPRWIIPRSFYAKLDSRPTNNIFYFDIIECYPVQKRIPGCAARSIYSSG